MTLDPYGLLWRRSEWRVTYARLRRGDLLWRLALIPAALWMMGAWVRG